VVLITKSGAETLKIGSAGPDFKGLPGTDGRIYDLEMFQTGKAVVLSFTCNHCPYAQAYEDRFIALAKEFAPQGVAFLAINPNDEVHYPEDGFDQMKVRAAEKKFPYPYLRDESQRVAKAYGAVCTPHIFVLGKRWKLVYEGRIDDNWKEPHKVTSQDLRKALEAVVADKSVPAANTNPMGCSIKWKDKSFSTLIHRRLPPEEP
jgi:peroxiredoxin